MTQLLLVTEHVPDHVVLCIDAGATSGYALVRMSPTSRPVSAQRMLIDRGTVRAEDASELVPRLVGRAMGLPLLVVGEKWALAGMHRMVGANLHAAWKQWEYPLLRVVPKSRIIRVYPQVWRKAVFGRGNLRSEQAKRRAVQRAQAEWSPHVTDHNEAEALLLGTWAQHAPEVHEAARLKPRGKR